MKNYSNLSGFYNNPTVIDNARINGKLYGLPRPRVLGRPGLMIRQDWLDNLGLKMPTNAQEVYEVAKAFTLNDPDKNGQADTTGIEYADISTGSFGWNGISTLTVAAGGFNEWGLQDGKMTPDFLTTKYMDTLKLFNKMYNEKLMNQDFPLVTGTKRADVFNQGKVGMMFGTIDDAVGYQPKLSKVDPKAKLAIVPALSGDNGPKVASTPGHNGILMFSKTSVKTEKDLNKILAFYDTMTTPDMLDLFTYGVEGVNYKVDNGVKVSIENSNFTEDTSDLAMVIPRPGYVETPSDTEIKKAVNAAFKANDAYLVFNPTVAYESTTRNEKGGELDKLIFDARVKFVMGQMDEAGFNKVLEQWRKQGGDKIIEEFTQQYNILSKK
jgi:putative aldouronate transport system substrate-binding protein